MACQDVILAQAICRVHLSQRETIPGTAAWLAEVDVVDLDRHLLRPIVLPTGRRVAFPGDTEALALNAAVTFLAEEFGGFAEPPHGCVEWEPLRAGPAHVIASHR